MPWNENRRRYWHWHVNNANVITDCSIHKNTCTYSKHCTTVYSVTVSHIILYKLLVKSYIWCSKTRIWIFSYIKRRMCVLFSWPSWRSLACLIIYILFLWENRHRNKINKKNIYIWLIQSGATASSPYTKGCMVQYNEKYKTLTAI